MEILECCEFPIGHPVEKQRGVRILALQADQAFLDSLYEFPPGFPFKASILRNIYIRGGARRNPKDPKAKRPHGRTRLGQKAVKKFLKSSTEEVMGQAEGNADLNDKLSKAKIAKVSQKLIRSFNQLHFIPSSVIDFSKKEKSTRQKARLKKTQAIIILHKAKLL